MAVATAGPQAVSDAIAESCAVLTMDLLRARRSAVEGLPVGDGRDPRRVLKHDITRPETVTSPEHGARLSRDSTRALLQSVAGYELRPPLTR